ncbi:hypothetical protein RLOC_00013004 [Lonchura striata]|uniref:Uncharacterized protein n=1 Tax=Lonchura striata TaxID=40157 RepID=A0A218V5G0_9PASE|nr:hypothetical protein RLOC_00013004 [Lonchura striata domestica]
MHSYQQMQLHESRLSQPQPPIARTPMSCPASKINDFYLQFPTGTPLPTLPHTEPITANNTATGAREPVPAERTFS